MSDELLLQRSLFDQLSRADANVNNDAPQDALAVDEIMEVLRAIADEDQLDDGMLFANF